MLFQNYLGMSLTRVAPDNWSYNELCQYAQMSCAREFQTFNYSLVPEKYRKNIDVSVSALKCNRPYLYVQF